MYRFENQIFTQFRDLMHFVAARNDAPVEKLIIDPMLGTSTTGIFTINGKQIVYDLIVGADLSEAERQQLVFEKKNIEFSDDEI